jgi:hypothetical protein
MIIYIAFYTRNGFGFVCCSIRMRIYSWTIFMDGYMCQGIENEKKFGWHPGVYN